MLLKRRLVHWRFPPSSTRVIVSVVGSEAAAAVVSFCQPERRARVTVKTAVSAQHRLQTAGFKSSGGKFDDFFSLS